MSATPPRRRRADRGAEERHGELGIVSLAEEGEEIVEEEADVAVARLRIWGLVMAVFDQREDLWGGEDLVSYVECQQRCFRRELAVGKYGRGGLWVAVDVKLGVWC